jgi:Flp pilus assembly protein TadG
MKRIRARGAAAVETAFVLPLLALVVLGIVYFGWLFNNYVVLEQAAAAAAHTLASERGFASPCTDAQTAIQQVGTQVGAGTPLSKALSSSVFCTPDSTTKTSGLVTGAFIVGSNKACSTDSVCASNLGSSTSTPAPGTMATVTLTYTFGVPFTDSYRGANPFLTKSLSVSMSELVQ